MKRGRYTHRGLRTGQRTEKEVADAVAFAIKTLRSFAQLGLLSPIDRGYSLFPRYQDRHVLDLDYATLWTRAQQGDREADFLLREYICGEVRALTHAVPLPALQELICKLIRTNFPPAPRKQGQSKARSV